MARARFEVSAFSSLDVRFKNLGVAVCCVVLAAGCSGAARSGRAGATMHGERGGRSLDALQLEGALSGADQPSSGGSLRERSDDYRLPENPTLDDYLMVAAHRNEGLKAAFHHWRAAAEQAHAAGRLPDPRFSYTYYIERVETRVGPQRQSFSLSQMFPWFGKLALQRTERDNVERIAHARLEEERLSLFYQVKSAYWDFWLLARSIETTRDHLELAKGLESVVRTAYEAGDAGFSDLVRLRVEIGSLENRLQGLLDRRRPVAARLNAAMSRPHDAPLPEPSLPPGEPVEISEEDIFMFMEEMNPQLIAQRYEIARQLTSVELAQKDFYPDLTAGITYIDTGDAVMPGVRDSGKDPVMAMVSINLPLDRSRRRAAAAAARERHRAAATTLEESRNELQARLEAALYDKRDASREAGLFKDTLIPEAVQALEVTEAAFRAGLTGFADLIDAQRMQLEFELSYNSAVAQREKSLALLEMLTASELRRPQRAGLPEDGQGLSGPVNVPSDIGEE